MSKTVWRSGPPPSVGWWPASAYEDADVIRWWNGKRWSDFCRSFYPLSSVEHQAGRPAHEFDTIKWTDRPASWPARSRT